MPRSRRTTGHIPNRSTQWVGSILFVVSVHGVQPVMAQDDPADPLLQTIAEAATDQPSLLQGTRLSLDTSTRHMVSTSDGDWDGLSAIGIDLLQDLSTNQTEWGELLLQGFLLGSHRWEEHPPFIADESTWTPQLRLAYLDLTGPFQKKLALRIGHIGIPYGIGLPYTINTNGTLQQYIAVPNIGFKLDYGASVHGELSMLEYEVMVGRGSGVNYVGTEGSWLVSGRVGTPERRTWIFGLSGYRGHQLTPLGILDRTRVGLDGRVHGPVDLMVEASYGMDDSTRQVFNVVEEVSWRTGTESVMAYVQHRYLNGDLGGDNPPAQSVVPGVRVYPFTGWTFEANYDRALSGLEGQPPRQVLAAQLRSRWALGGVL